MGSLPPLFLLSFSSLSPLFLLSFSSLSPLFLFSFSSLSPVFLLSFSSLSPLFLLSFSSLSPLFHFSPTDFMFRLTSTDSTFVVTFLSFSYIAVVPVIVIFFTADVIVEATSRFCPSFHSTLHDCLCIEVFF